MRSVLLVNLLVLAACDAGPEPPGLLRESLPPHTHVVLSVADSAGTPLTPVYARWRYPVGSGDYRYRDARCLCTACTRFAVAGPTVGIIEVEVSTRRISGACLSGDVAFQRIDVRAPAVAEVLITLPRDQVRCGVFGARPVLVPTGL